VIKRNDLKKLTRKKMEINESDSYLKKRELYINEKKKYMTENVSIDCQRKRI
jgi:hypothetical protein